MFRFKPNEVPAIFTKLPAAPSLAVGIVTPPQLGQFVIKQIYTQFMCVNNETEMSSAEEQLTRDSY